MCDADEECERFHELFKEYNLVRLLIGTDPALQLAHENLLESEFWDKVYWSFLEKLIDDKKFKILILKTLLFEYEE